MDPATLKFQQSIPYLLLPVSSQLAALHTIRARASIPYTCSRCGSAASSTRSKRNATEHRVISTTCSSCGTVTSFPIGPGNAASFPSWKKKARSSTGKEQGQSPTPLVSTPTKPTTPVPGLMVTTNPVAAQSQKVQPQNAKTVKKKPGLQEMLQRNRDKDQRTKADQTKSTGLSAFLSTL